MIFYQFYTNPSKSEDSLVYRTNDNEDGSPSWSKEKENLKMFPQIDGIDGARKDFYKILFDNENFREGKYFDTDAKVKEKVVKKKQDAPQKESADSHLYSIPEGFSIELNKVYNMDAITFMKTLPKGYIDYIFTSPPYNVGSRVAFGENNKIYLDDTDMYAMYDDAKSNESYRSWLFEFVDEMLRVTSKHIFMNIQMLGNNKLTVMELFWRYRMNIKDMIIWNKTIASPHINKKIMTSAFEFIFVFSNSSPEKRTFEDSHFDSKFRNVITGVNSSQNKYRTLNKATFPLYLPRKIMQQFGKPGDIWYDPCSGTGTTFHAAVLENKNFLGTELDIEQCNATNDRIRTENGKIKINFPEHE